MRGAGQCDIGQIPSGRKHLFHGRCQWKIFARGQLSILLRNATLVDVDCWGRVPGEPLRPMSILEAIRGRMPRGGAK